MQSCQKSNNSDFRRKRKFLFRARRKPPALFTHAPHSANTLSLALLLAAFAAGLAFRLVRTVLSRSLLFRRSGRLCFGRIGVLAVPGLLGLGGTSGILLFACISRFVSCFLVRFRISG